MSDTIVVAAISLIGTIITVWAANRHTLAELDSAIFSTFGSIGVGCVIYVAALALIGGILKEDMERIPMVGKFGVKLFLKLGIFKN